jgi:hypothetical protein
LTSALDGGEWSTSRPSHITPQGKNHRYPFDRRLGGLQSQFGRGDEEKNSQPLPGLEPPIIQPAAQRYTTELARLLGIGQGLATSHLKKTQLVTKCYMGPRTLILWNDLGNAKWICDLEHGMFAESVQDRLTENSSKRTGRL